MSQKQKTIEKNRWQKIADLMKEKRLDIVLICATQQDFGFGYALSGLKPIMYHYLTLDKVNGRLTRGYFVPKFLVGRLGLSKKKNVVAFDDKKIPHQFEAFLRGNKRVGVLGPAPAVHFSKTNCEMIFLDDYLWPLLNIKDKEEIASIEATAKLLKLALEKAARLIVPGTKMAEIADILDRELLKKADALAFPSFVESLSGRTPLVYLLGDAAFVKKNDLVFINVGAELNGYFADAGRCFAVNNPELKKKVRLIEKAFASFVRGLKPGMKLCDLPGSLQKQLEKSGIKNVKLDKNYIGHSVGFNIINMPYIGESIFREELLAANTTLSFFIDVEVDGKKFISQDTVLVGTKKNRILTA